MGVFSMTAGFATLGFATRCFALALQKRNIMTSTINLLLPLPDPLTSSFPAADLGGHGIAMTAFGTIGYLLNGVEERQLQTIQARKEVLISNRAALEAAAASS